MTITDDWHSLYRAGWKGLIMDEAFAHPAKFARSLIKHIYEHCIAEGWLHEGDVVIDLFGGVALGGLDAMRLGLNWMGVELEPKFVDLGNRNIALWNSRYAGKLPKWGTATLLQGDSRRLLEVIAGADACVSSPPYSESNQDYQNGWKYIRRRPGDKRATRKDMQRGADYGSTPGQLAALPEGSVDAAISSPPFGDKVQHDGGPALQQGGELHSDYGSTPGNLGNLRADDRDHADAIADAVVSSPPYAESLSRNHYGSGIDWDKAKTDIGAGVRHQSPGQSVSSDYGNTPGQLGTESGDTFWSAARAIMAQTFAALRPGGHAVWVVKAFVRDGRRVEFPDQWRQLCESVGFVTLHIHRAWLVEDHGTQLAVDGNHKRHRKERKSFFRRLAESKGSPRIDYETIVCMEKPDA